MPVFLKINSFSVNGVVLENVTSHKILGVLIDNNLSWKQHIEHLCAEVSKLIGLLWRNKHLLPYSSCVLFYNSYIQPRIDYCLPIWLKASAIHLDKIFRLQKRAIRTVFNVPYDTPTQDLFKQSGWISIHQRYLYQLCITVHKILSSFDSPLSSLVTLHQPAHIYNLRSNSNPLLLQVPFPRKEIFKQSFIYSAPTCLLINIPTINSFECFKRTCKRYLLDTSFLFLSLVLKEF